MNFKLKKLAVQEDESNQSNSTPVQNESNEIPQQNLEAQHDEINDSHEYSRHFFCLPNFIQYI